MHLRNNLPGLLKTKYGGVTISQRELANQTGLTRQTVASWITNRYFDKFLSVETAFTWCLFLGCEFHELLTVEGIKS